MPIEQPKTPTFSPEAELLKKQGVQIVSENIEDGTVTLKNPEGEDKTFNMNEVLKARTEALLDPAKKEALDNGEKVEMDAVATKPDHTPVEYHSNGAVTDVQEVSDRAREREAYIDATH